MADDDSGVNYKPISDYAVVGNLRSVGLIGRDGAVDWLCFPHMDRPSVFAALLDVRRGGRFRVAPASPDAYGDQQYLEGTNVLVTEFRLGTGVLRVTDFMPLTGNLRESMKTYAPQELHRIVECEGDRIAVAVEWSPRFDYARADTAIRPVEGGWLASASNGKMSLSYVENGNVSEEPYGPHMIAQVTMHPGERMILVCRWNSEETRVDVDDSMKLLNETVDAWRRWRKGGGTERWAGEWLPYVERSELVLKLLEHADSGAIAAAPTTSLPETIGGVRNWDYRYFWIRDASLTSQALISLGHYTEAEELFSWLEHITASHFEEGFELQVMYGLHGERDIPEFELPHFEGYRGSRPVRIGNAAVKQLQLGVYGELFNTAYELLRRGKALGDKVMHFLSNAADHVCGIWRSPDKGIWEMRSEPRHFTYSKVMAWVALDRAVHLSKQYGLAGEERKWAHERDKIREEVLRHGYNDQVGAFVQSFGSTELDAATLRIPLLEFLPIEDERVQNTIDRILEKLTVNDFVCRYTSDDGLPGKEGAFGLSTFWMVDVLALSGRIKEARRIFENTIRRANHVKLFAEQFDPRTGEFLGNFPQAFTHIGLINSVLYLAHAEGRELPEHAPTGTPQHREVAGQR